MCDYNYYRAKNYKVSAERNTFGCYNNNQSLFKLVAKRIFSYISHNHQIIHFFRKIFNLLQNWNEKAERRLICLCFQMINGIKMIKKTHKNHSDTIKSAKSIQRYI